MINKRQLLALLVLSGCIIAMLPGCEGEVGIQGPAGSSQPFVTAFVKSGDLTYSNDLGPGRANAVIESAPSIPTVSINDVRLGYVIHNPDEAMSYQNGALPVEAGDSSHLLINYVGTDGSQKSAEAHVVVPGYFDSPGIDTIHLGPADQRLIEWPKSQGAESYTLYMYSYIYYLDTAGTRRRHATDIITHVMDTFYMLPAGYFFPDPDEVSYLEPGHYCSIDIDALCGACTSGEPGNITGDAYGYFVGVTDGPFIRVHFDIPPPGVAEQDEVVAGDRNDQRMLEYLVDQARQTMWQRN